MRDYDVIVIGSGAGGLTAAVALANLGKRVLVLEQHTNPGGWCHSFVLGGHRFSPGVHYVGEMAEGRSLRRLYEGLGAGGDLEFCQLNEDGYDHFLVGDHRFDVPAGFERFRDRLTSQYPHERAGVEDFMDIMSKVAREFGTTLKALGRPEMVALPLRARHLLFYGAQRLGPLLDKRVSDPLVRAFLTAQAGDYGVPPSAAPTLLHASLMAHYFDGGYYPRGGAHRIPRALIRQLKRKGGDVRLNTPVRRIIVEADSASARGVRAVGVEIAGGDCISADLVVSNADPEMTLRRLVGEQHLSYKLRKKLSRTTYGPSSLALFLATDLDLGSMGYDSGNYWFYAHPDVDSVYDMTKARLPAPGDDDDGGIFPGAFVTITTLKDPSKRKGTSHTLEVFAMAPWEPFERFAKQPQGERSDAYRRYKDMLGQRLLRTAERVIPGLSQHVTFMEVGTPLTNQHFVAAHHGAVYGITKSRRQLGPGAFPVVTEIPGLFMCGASTLSHGVSGASLSGLVCAAKAAQCRLKDLYVPRDEQARVTIYASERPHEWVDRLQARRDARAERGPTTT